MVLSLGEASPPSNAPALKGEERVIFQSIDKDKKEMRVKTKEQNAIDQITFYTKLLETRERQIADAEKKVKELKYSRDSCSRLLELYYKEI